MAPITRLVGLMMFILQSGMLTLIICKFRVTPMKFYVGLSFSLTEQPFMADNDHQGSECPHLVLTHFRLGCTACIQEIGDLTTTVLPLSSLQSSQITLAFKVPIAFIVGDVEGHDKLCGRYKVHHNIKQLCHKCDCLLEDVDDPNVCCIWTRASDIALLVNLWDLKALKEISYLSIHNAFTSLCFGATIYGINGCCPGENLHMVQKGLMLLLWLLFTKIF